jgi:ornithine carbamoyltransferase
MAGTDSHLDGPRRDGPRHFLRSVDLTPGEQATVLERAATLKRDRDAALAAGRDPRTDALHGRTVAIVFEKPSLRTRVSFEVGIHELGGHPMKVDDAEIGLGKRETIADTAKVLSRYVQGIVLRTFGQERIDELAEHATVPVVNALTDHEHPCQALADLQTLHQAFGDVAGRTLTYVGDGNNVAHSLLVACAQAGVNVRVAHPDGYAPADDVVAAARSAGEASGAEVVVTTDVRAAAEDADALYTDVWTSMGQEAQNEERLARFEGFQVDASLLSLAADGAIVLHCLPAHRGEEIAAEVIDGPASRVFDQAENRLHAQKALLLHLLSPSGGRGTR